MKELHKRLLVSGIFIPLILVVLYLRGIPLLVTFALVSVLGMSELILMLRQRSIRLGWSWLAVSLIAFLGFSLYRGFDLVILSVILLFALLDSVLAWDAETSLLRALTSFFGVIYTALLPALLVRIGEDFAQPYLLLGLIALIWCADSAAYFIGMRWGKRRNVLPMSPNKSLEGIIAGAVVPFLIVIILYVTRLYSDLAILLSAAFAAGIIGQLGDSAESMLKRWCSVKDSSKLIPGHGGVLDRLDSVLLAGTFLYSAMMILTKVR